MRSSCRWTPSFLESQQKPLKSFPAGGGVQGATHRGAISIAAINEMLGYRSARRKVIDTNENPPFIRRFSIYKDDGNTSFESSGQARARYGTKECYSTNLMRLHFFQIEILKVGILRSIAKDHRVIAFAKRSLG